MQRQCALPLKKNDRSWGSAADTISFLGPLSSVGVSRDHPTQHLAAVSGPKADASIVVDTTESDHRLDLLHRNIRRIGTISNT